MDLYFVWTVLYLAARTFVQSLITVIPTVIHHCFSPFQNVIGDEGFTRKRTHVIFPFKPRKKTNRRHRRKWNKCIRKQRMVNEWNIGLVINPFRLFLNTGHLRRVSLLMFFKWLLFLITL